MSSYLHKYRMLIIIIMLLVAYGLFRIVLNMEARNYSQEIANNLSIPSDVILVDSQIIYIDRCKSSNIIQYFTTDKSWDTISSYYVKQIQSNWQPAGGELSFYKYPSAYEQIYLVFHRIDLSQEEFPNNPLLKQSLMKGKTAYSVLVDYKQDTRAYSGICKSED